jgi:hypothetical protein
MSAGNGQTGSNEPPSAGTAGSWKLLGQASPTMRRGLAPALGGLAELVWPVALEVDDLMRLVDTDEDRLASDHAPVVCAHEIGAAGVLDDRHDPLARLRVVIVGYVLPGCGMAVRVWLSDLRLHLLTLVDVVEAENARICESAPAVYVFHERPNRLKRVLGRGEIFDIGDEERWSLGQGIAIIATGRAGAERMGSNGHKPRSCAQTPPKWAESDCISSAEVERPKCRR